MAKVFLTLIAGLFLLQTETLTYATGNEGLPRPKLIMACADSLTSDDQLSPGTRIFLLVSPNHYRIMPIINSIAKKQGMGKLSIIVKSYGMIRGILNYANVADLSQIQGVDGVGIGTHVLISEAISNGSQELKQDLLNQLERAGFYPINSGSDLIYGYVLSLAAIDRLRAIPGVDIASLVNNALPLSNTQEAHEIIDTDAASGRNQ